MLYIDVLLLTPVTENYFIIYNIFVYFEQKNNG